MQGAMQSIRAGRTRRELSGEFPSLYHARGLRPTPNWRRQRSTDCADDADGESWSAFVHQSIVNEITPWQQGSYIRFGGASRGFVHRGVTGVVERSDGSEVAAYLLHCDRCRLAQRASEAAGPTQLRRQRRSFLAADRAPSFTPVVLANLGRAKLQSYLR